MSVLIKDMEMPKSCYECKLDLRSDICSAFCEWNAEHPYSIRATDRLPDCPLSEVPSVTPECKTGKWIPCSERLPIEARHYLCSFNRPNRVDRIYVDLAYWTGGSWYGFRQDQINAWMPLPESYSGE